VIDSKTTANLNLQKASSEDIQRENIGVREKTFLTKREC
jgi:hypothetical protein